MSVLVHWTGQERPARNERDSGTIGVNMRDDAGTWERLAHTHWRDQLFHALDVSWKAHAGREPTSFESRPASGSATVFLHNQEGRPARAPTPPSLAKLITPGGLPEEFRILVTHRWEGTVRVTGEDHFEALLMPIDEEGPEVIADISNEAVDEDDRDLVVPGAPFYLTVGKHLGRGGRHVSTQSLRFRRLGKWRQEELAHLQEAGRKWRAALDFDDSQ